jgi:ribosomal protein L21E
MKRVGGSRRKTRLKFKKSIRKKGKIGITAYLKKFEVGDRVMLLAEPA